MTGLEMIRTALVGVAIFFVVPGFSWRDFNAGFVVIAVLCLTDWIAEDHAEKEARKVRDDVANALRQIGGVR